MEHILLKEFTFPYEKSAEITKLMKFNKTFNIYSLD